MQCPSSISFIGMNCAGDNLLITVNMFYSSDTDTSPKTRAESDGGFWVGCEKHNSATKRSFSEVVKSLYIMTLNSFVNHFLMTRFQMVYSKDVFARPLALRGPQNRCVTTM